MLTRSFATELRCAAPLVEAAERRRQPQQTTAAYADVRNQTDVMASASVVKARAAQACFIVLDVCLLSSASRQCGKSARLPRASRRDAGRTQDLLRRSSPDAEGLLPGFGSTLYLIEQRAGNYADRRAAGTELPLQHRAHQRDRHLRLRRAVPSRQHRLIPGTYNLPDTLTINALCDYRRRRRRCN